MGCLEHGVLGSSHVSMANLFLFTDLMGILEPGARGSSRARMGCLCVDKLLKWQATNPHDPVLIARNPSSSS